MEKIVINNHLNYYLIRKQHMKRMILRLKEEDIVVSAPSYIPIKQINQFVETSQDKIEQMREKKKIKIQYQDGGIAKILGTTYHIKLINQNRYLCELKDEYLYVYHSNIEKCVKKFLKLQLYDIVMVMIKKYPLTLRQHQFIPELKIKELKSMHGVCYYHKDCIAISLMMIHEPLWVIEYVVVHELAHFIHQNHSKDFYHTVKNLLPNYKDAITYLKKGGY